MTIEAISALPIADLADRHARIFLWTTNRFLPGAFDVLRAWGFSYKQTIVWHKDGNPSPWGGSVAPNHAEYLLVGVRGKPQRLQMWKTNVIGINVGRHSQKPERFIDLIEQVSPGPYLELFARRPRLGWSVWGNEVESTIALAAD